MDGKPQRERAASLYALGHPQNLNDVKQAAAHKEDLGSRCLISCAVRVLFLRKQERMMLSWHKRLFLLDMSKAVRG